MRQILKKMDEERGVFTGRFGKYGLKTGYRGPSTETVLLMEIRDGAGVVVCDHLWLNLTKGFEELGILRAGDLVQFEARVKQYRKGYVNRKAGIDQRRDDYKLSHPTKIVRVKGGR